MRCRTQGFPSRRKGGACQHLATSFFLAAAPRCCCRDAGRKQKTVCHSQARRRRPALSASGAFRGLLWCFNQSHKFMNIGELRASGRKPGPSFCTAVFFVLDTGCSFFLFSFFFCFYRFASSSSPPSSNVATSGGLPLIASVSLRLTTAGRFFRN